MDINSVVDLLNTNTVLIEYQYYKIILFRNNTALFPLFQHSYQHTVIIKCHSSIIMITITID